MASVLPVRSGGTAAQSCPASSHAQGQVERLPGFLVEERVGVFETCNTQHYLAYQKLLVLMHSEIGASHSKTNSSQEREMLALRRTVRLAQCNNDYRHRRGPNSSKLLLVRQVTSAVLGDLPGCCVMTDTTSGFSAPSG